MQKVGSTVALLQRIWDWVSGKTEDFGQSFKYFPLLNFSALKHEKQRIYGEIYLYSSLTLAVKLQNGDFLSIELQNGGLNIIEEILLVLPNRGFMYCNSLRV